MMRSKLRAVTRRMGLSDAMREQTELVCNEMMTNQLKYAEGSGVVQLWETNEPSKALDLFALDYGPGIEDLPIAEADGYTTGGTMGKGLGAIRRMAHESEIYTITGATRTGSAWHGVAIWARVYVDPKKRHLPGSYQIGAYVRAYHDDIYNGDCLAFTTNDKRLRWLHVDGLGHGREAAETVRGIDAMLDTQSPIDEILQRVAAHVGQRRGAVALVADVDIDTNELCLCGVGDMSAFSCSNRGKKHMRLKSGILGQTQQRAQTEIFPVERHAIFITATDGLRTTWSVEQFPNLYSKHPQMVALFLGQVMGRTNDDRSLFIIRPTYMH